MNDVDNVTDPSIGTDSLLGSSMQGVNLANMTVRQCPVQWWILRGVIDLSISNTIFHVNKLLILFFYFG